MKYFARVNGKDVEVELVERLGELIVSVDGERTDIEYAEVDRLGQVIALAGGLSYGASIEDDGQRVHVTIAGQVYAVDIEDERERAAHAAERAKSAGGGTVQAVMPGVVARLLVAVGDGVEAGQPLLVLEAMKMQNEIPAPAAGVVTALHVAEGKAVAAGAKLVTLAPRPA